MIKEHRDKAQGLNDLLNYALLVDEGIALLKDGAFLAGSYYLGPDLNSSENSSLEALSLSVNNTLCQLGDGWMIHADLCRKPSRGYPEKAQQHFPDAVSLMIDEERRQQYHEEGAHFESQYALTLTYLPPSSARTSLMQWFIEDDHSTTDKGWEQLLAEFKDKLGQTLNSLSKSLKLQPMDSQALVTHLHQCVTGLSHTLTLPKIPTYLDCLIASQDFTGGLVPKIGQHWIQMIGLTGLPFESEPGLLSLLDNLPIAFRLSSRFILLDAHTAQHTLKSYRRNWFQKRLGLMGMVKQVFNAEPSGFENQDALDMALDADGAIQENEAGLVRYGFYTSNLILMHESREELTELTRYITKQIEQCGFTARIETLNALEAYLGSLPGHGFHNVRRPIIHSLNLADLLPLTSVWAGSEKHLCRYYPTDSSPLMLTATTGATPFRLNLHVSDIGHTLIVGDTGMGKSTLIGMLAAQHLRYPEAQVFLFDKGYSANILCQAVNGTHYDIGGEQQSLSFYPLARIDEPNELDWACEWIEELLHCQRVVVSTAIRKEIRASLSRLALQDSRTLTDYQGTVQHQDIKDALETYTLSGALGNLLDADSDGLRDSHFQVFEMKHLMEKGEQYIRPVLLYLFHQLDLRTKGRPSLIFIEEGHTFLKGQFGEKLNQLLREKRKDNTAIIFITQKLSEILQSEYAHVILDSCQTKLFLPNPNAGNPSARALYQQVGLSDKQIEIIQKAVPKQDYYYSSTLGNRLITLGLGDIALSFVGVDSAQDRQKVERLKTAHPENWVFEWLKHRGQEAWANYYLELKQATASHKGGQ